MDSASIVACFGGIVGLAIPNNRKWMLNPCDAVLSFLESHRPRPVSITLEAKFDQNAGLADVQTRVDNEGHDVHNGRQHQNTEWQE